MKTGDYTHNRVYRPVNPLFAIKAVSCCFLILPAIGLRTILSTNLDPKGVSDGTVCMAGGRSFFFAGLHFVGHGYRMRRWRSADAAAHAYTNAGRNAVAHASCPEYGCGGVCRAHAGASRRKGWRRELDSYASAERRAADGAVAVRDDAVCNRYVVHHGAERHPGKHGVDS